MWGFEHGTSRLKDPYLTHCANTCDNDSGNDDSEDGGCFGSDSGGYSSMGRQAMEQLLCQQVCL